jgi:hypothetical protein
MEMRPKWPLWDLAYCNTAAETLWMLTRERVALSQATGMPQEATPLHSCAQNAAPFAVMPECRT